MDYWDQDTYSPLVYPPMHMPGYYQPNPAQDNPIQELMVLGYREPRFKEIAGTDTEQFGTDLKLDGIDNAFVGFGASKKKARRAAALSALEYLYEPGNASDVMSPKRMPLYPHSMYPSTWAEPAPVPLRPIPHKTPETTRPVPAIAPAKPLTPVPPKETPFTILLEKYPEAVIKSESTTCVTIGDKEFSLTVPGNNAHISRMHACVAALKTLDSMEFPAWDQKLDRLIKNFENPHDMSLHPVTLLLREFGSRNISFKQDVITEPCSITVCSAGKQRVFTSGIFPNKRQAKYEAAMEAIRELGLDKKYTNIQACKSEDRKRTHDEMKAMDTEVNELGKQLSVGLEVEATPPQEDQAETVTPKLETQIADSPADPPADTPAVDTPAVDTPAVDTPSVDTPAVDTPSRQMDSPKLEKKIRLEVPQHNPGDTDTPSLSGAKRMSPRYSRRGIRNYRPQYRGQSRQGFGPRRYF